MGAEQLEDFEFEPLFLQCAPELNGKDIALFGSYGWGDGEWMQTWEDQCKELGAHLVCNSVIANEAPDDTALAACRNLAPPGVIPPINANRPGTDLLYRVVFYLSPFESSISIFG